MAPLPYNNNPRAYIEYTSEGQEHVMQVRMAPASGSADAASFYSAISSALAPLMLPTDAFTGVRFSGSGSTLSFPVAVSAVPGTFVGTAPDGREPMFISLTGRSADGRRVRCTFFTPLVDIDEQYREVITAGTRVELWQDALELTSDGARTISGLVPVWNSYFNVGFNAYFQRKQRRAG